jgi:hypothetical protein
VGFLVGSREGMAAVGVARKAAAVGDGKRASVSLLWEDFVLSDESMFVAKSFTQWLEKEGSENDCVALLITTAPEPISRSSNTPITIFSARNRLMAQL